MNTPAVAETFPEDLEHAWSALMALQLRRHLAAGDRESLSRLTEEFDKQRTVFEQMLEKAESRCADVGLARLRLRRLQNDSIASVLVTQVLVWIQEHATSELAGDVQCFREKHAALCKIRADVTDLLFEHLYDEIERIARAIVGAGMRRDEPIEDIVQEATLSLFKALARGQYDEALQPGVPYLRMITRRRRVDLGRRNQTRARNIPEQSPSVDEDGEVRDPVDVLASESFELSSALDIRTFIIALVLTYQDIFREMELRSPKRALVWRMTQVEGVPNEEAAARLGNSPNTIAVQRLNARKEFRQGLRQCLENHDIDEVQINQIIDRLPELIQMLSDDPS